MRWREGDDGSYLRHGEHSSPPDLSRTARDDLVFPSQEGSPRRSVTRGGTRCMAARAVPRVAEGDRDTLLGTSWFPVTTGFPHADTCERVCRCSWRIIAGGDRGMRTGACKGGMHQEGGIHVGGATYTSTCHIPCVGGRARRVTGCLAESASMYILVGGQRWWRQGG